MYSKTKALALVFFVFAFFNAKNAKFFAKRLCFTTKATEFYTE